LRPRDVPRLGASVVAAYLAVHVPGRIVQVDADLRGVEVELNDGERLRFALSRATGTFIAQDSSRARLLFD
jgi:hypothetical protein